MTKEAAVALASSDWWKPLTAKERAMFQLFEERLCMPFDVFHEAVETTLGRPVQTLEFGLNVAGLQRELLGEAPAPTMEQILNLIPPEKRIVLIGTESL